VTGAELNVSEAIRAGILDTTAGIYTNLRTGEVISLGEAIERNLVKIDGTCDDDDDLSRDEKVIVFLYC